MTLIPDLPRAGRFFIQTLLMGALLLGFCVPPALAWWDTQVRAQKAEPLVAEFPADQLTGRENVTVTDIRQLRAESGDRPTIVQDPQADGGAGSAVAFVAPGQSLHLTTHLNRSTYSIWVIARAREEDFFNPEEPVELDVPGGPITVPLPRPPVYIDLILEEPGQATRQWRMPAIFRTDYAVVSKIYFPLHVDGTCQLTIRVGEESAIGLLIDRIEIRDVLGDLPRTGAKTQPMVSKRHEGAGAKATLDEQQRQANDEIWASMPAINRMEGTDQWRQWHTVIGRNNRGRVLDLATAFENSGQQADGWNAAVTLIALAEIYPSLDYFYSEVGQYSNLQRAGSPVWGSRLGKNVYSGWAGGDLMRIAEAYDKAFDFIDGNQALADYVQTQIPWVQSPEDVIELLDTNILQHGMDALKRRIIRSDQAAAYIPLIQGVNDISYHMLDTGLFTAIHMNMADAGGLDDQAFTSFSRDGVHYTGATGYVGPALENIANILTLYREAGGDPRFDINDPERYPHMQRATYTVNALRAAGGMPFIIGDSMDMRRGREDDRPAYPSRVLEGFGAVILEDGQALDNPLAKRAVVARTGIGRGHAHQDSLNLELLAHGVRLMPDLGGRHEGSRTRAAPNMRTNRMHNMVWIDRTEFQNVVPGSTTSGTGWTTSFSPQPGVQYMANQARATSHPEVSVYQRATAMIDGVVTPDSAEVYLFDVFRVQGGHEHVYAFHGAYSETIEANIELKPAQSELAHAILDRRPEESRLEGVVQEKLVMTWPLRESLQKSHQREHFQEDRPVALTLTLFDRQQENVFIGSASSEAYPVDMPYLHVHRADPDQPMVSIYPALMEAHAGPRFITASEQLGVSPAPAGDVGAGVAVAVTLASGRRDLCFSSLHMDVPYRVADGTQVTGEFGFLAVDDQGLHSAHLAGGTLLERDGIRITAERATYEATIEAVNYFTRVATLSHPLPATILDGQMSLIHNDQRADSFQIGWASGHQAQIAHTPRYYQSTIVTIDEENGWIETELEPAVYGADPRFTQGTTITNEAHDRFWKASVEPRERWMYMGWPGTRLSTSNVMTLDDLPTDEQGRRVVRLIQERPGAEVDEEVLLEMEVTRVDPEENLFYFAMPAPPQEGEQDFRYGGWQYVRRIVENADGSKRWLASFPGTSFIWDIEEGQIRDGDFTDEDGDGKRKLFAYLFGPGDSLTMKTFVHVQRVQGGYEVRANVPCTIELPGMAPIRLSAEDLANAKGVYRIASQSPRQP